MIASLLAAAVISAVFPPPPPPARPRRRTGGASVGGVGALAGHCRRPWHAQRSGAARAPGAIKLDGKLDDASWAAARPTTAFRQHYPLEAAAPSEPTIMRVLYDEHALYIGIDCTQKSTPVLARLTRRDRVVTADRITVDISSRSDRVTAFHFGVNAAGVLDDGIYFNDSEYSADWDENWAAETSVRPDGWSVELKIPFRILRFDDAPAQRWGLQVTRYTALRNETDIWAWRPRGAPGYVSTFGTLDGLSGVKPSRPWEVRFSEILRLRFRDPEARAGTVAKPRDWNVNFELSGKGHPTQGTTLDLTINPDFGLVEADQVVLNLSNYEVFYPEKRPFFLEGQDTWSTPRSVFYTRRIGARPADPTLAAGELLGDHLGPSPIRGAAKFVGATSPRSSVGALSAITGENAATVISRDPATNDLIAVKRTVDPFSVYNVLRARYLPGLGGDIGILATAANRVERSGTPTVNDAYAVATDGRWRSPSANYVVAGQLVSSLLVGGPPRPQKDGIDVEPGRPALGGTLTAAKQGVTTGWLRSVSPCPSDSSTTTISATWIARTTLCRTPISPTAPCNLGGRPPTPPPRWRSHTARRWTAFDWKIISGCPPPPPSPISGEPASRRTTTRLTSTIGKPETAPRSERAGLLGTELWAGTDSRRLFTGTIWLQGQRLTDGWQVHGAATLMMRASSRVELELLPDALYTTGEPRFIERDPRFYYFGRLRVKNIGVTARATVGLTPRLTLQLYSQLFLATTEYSEPSQFRLSPGAFRSQIRLDDLQPIASWRMPGHAAGDAERQCGAALGIPDGLDHLPNLHARADADSGSDRRTAAGRGCAWRQPRIHGYADAESILLVGLRGPRTH